MDRKVVCESERGKGGRWEPENEFRQKKLKRKRRKGQTLNIKRRGDGKRFTGLHVLCRPDKEDSPPHLTELKWLEENLNGMRAAGNDRSSRDLNTLPLEIISTGVSRIPSSSKKKIVQF